jgi:SAM-dependent methyltransferase
VLHVDRAAGGDDRPAGRMLIHGRIVHGLQFDEPEKRRVPTTYYSPSAGIGLVMRGYSREEPVRVGLVGLGVGTLAAYGRPGDYFRFYEINPDVIWLAREHFTFLDDTPATTDVVLGDARLSLERESNQHFDVLVLDAFTGDAIPVHLLTREAFAVYRRHLKPDGVLAVNISNRHLDLVPVLAGLARHDDYQWLQVHSPTDTQQGAIAAHWMVLTRNERLLQDEAVLAAASVPNVQYAPTKLWTDDYNNLLTVLK